MQIDNRRTRNLLVEITFACVRLLYLVGIIVKIYFVMTAMWAITVLLVFLSPLWFVEHWNRVKKWNLSPWKKLQLQIIDGPNLYCTVIYCIEMLGVLIFLLATGVMTKEHGMMTARLFDEELGWRPLVVLSASETFSYLGIFCLMMRLYWLRSSPANLATPTQN